MNRYFTESHKNRRLHVIVLAVLMLMPSMAWADIVIGGSVYGGGKQGAVGTANTPATNSTEAVDVTLSDASSEASQVTIKSGSILAVFGGGERGRSYGVTNVTIDGGTVGVTGAAADALSDNYKSVNGNAFGAGDGSEAITFGGSVVTINGGTIENNVYGGGNAANLVGTTTVDLKGGTYNGDVYGGSKIANIYGRTFVNINGASLTANMSIANVYGGNDIAGIITPATNSNWTWAKTDHANMNLPFTLATTGLSIEPNTVVDKSWNALILASKSENYEVRIGNLYGGGNGDYDYTSGTNDGMRKPELDRVYLQIEGGVFGNLYGGGNAATVTNSTDICLVNKDEHNFVDSYQFDRVFGGNNKAEMAIRPNWYLKEARINNLYSGGNAGAMTYYDAENNYGGILLAIESADMTVNNVYGGCRMADVIPGGNSYNSRNELIAENLYGTTFEKNHAARVLIKGGNINNVYGGNDVSGNVYYGSQVEVLSSINGDIYGAGNGSYAYTDNPNLKDDSVYGDYYYNGGTGGLASAQALSIHRPNAAQSYVHVAGTSATPTYIGGAIYCGGNSATLRALGDDVTALKNAKAELHIGSYVIADNVFLGSNGENMVKSETADDLLQIYKNGPVGYDKATKGAYSSMNLTNSAQFEEYMRGVEVAIKPTVTFDEGYVSHSTKFGSLYCGGNVGSMSADGYFNVDFLQKLVIYNKLVGGCNNANVAKTDYNAFHLGGLTGAPDANNNKVLLTVAGLQLEPRVLTGNVKDGFKLDKWNKAPIAGVTPAKDMLIGGNIYGGCYSSGYINGGVNIDIQQNAISPNVFTESGVTYEEVRDDVLASTLAAYGGGYGKETEIWGNVTVSITGNGQIMKAYGGGEMGVVGKLQRNGDGEFLTENVQEWYSHTEFEDVHGYNTPVTRYDSKDHTVAKFADDYNSTVNLNADLPDGNGLNVAKFYGGGFQGTVSGNTTVNLIKGRIYDAFGGASNADILGHTEMYVGNNVGNNTYGPTVTHNVYGANDFGGLIVGHETFLVDNNKDGDNADTMEKIVAQTYVEYILGNIAGDLFGGPCGAYEYDNSRYATIIDQPGFCKPQLLEDLLTNAMLTPLSGAGYAANSFVNVVSQSPNDVITGSIFGAGQGLKGHINLADERGSYVRLMAATKGQRTAGELSGRVYGAGFCSNTNRSLVDAHTGYFGALFGGAHGITYQELTDMELTHPEGHYETNYMGYRSAVRLYEMANNQMDIYGGGANAGSQETGVVLNGGEARYVYGASYAQGISYASSVEIPENSTSRVRAIFGGAEGGSDAYPCDAYNTFVTWSSENARVQDAIYGGNNAYRMTRNSYVSINKPVKNFEDQLTNVFGGGYGENTVTLYTSVSLQDGAQVANVYGGGNNGQVLDTPSFRYYLDDGQMACLDGTTKPAADGLKSYPASLNITADTPDKDKLYGYQKYLRDSEVIGFHSWIVQNCWDGVTKDDREQPLGSYTANAHGHSHPIYFLSTQMKDMKNTNVYINRGAVVDVNAYGGGLGEKALVSGETSVKLWGGIVKGDIYGGGYGGHVEEYPHLIYPAGGQTELTLSATNVELQGGMALNVYGGGLNGRVTGSTNVVLGTKDKGLFDFYGKTESGEFEHKVIYGDPIVERSLYGGGKMGPVYGSARVTYNQGHVGYRYDSTQEVDGNSTEKCYVENLDLKNAGDDLLAENGNVFGAGYGEGASVDNTFVNLYGGTIRNSLYGGGEIAAVGQGTMKVENGSNRVLDKITVPGRTHIYMYNGLVQGDVFGGGRGFSYDLSGNEVIGKTIFTDGYVFGTTDVNIRGGIIGTPETLEEGHGNVFGGGNIGYVYSDAVKHGLKGDHSDEGRYYADEYECKSCHHTHLSVKTPTVCPECHKTTTSTDSRFRTTFTKKREKILSEDTRVIVSPYAQVIDVDGFSINGHNYQKGDYVPTEDMNLLRNKNTDKEKWDKLSNAGINIRNAVFAGGNVAAGSDKVYANAVTVFGNATATLNDIFFKDLITVGTEHTGGLYGDGNLTFVDGYRELNITNYGTDYYGMSDNISLEDYKALNDRERAYFELKYKCKSDHSYTPDGGTETSYKQNQSVTEDVYNTFSDTEKENWEEAGFCSIYAGRLLNTIQRADFCGVFGSRMVLQGAQDRVPDVVDYTQYTLNRVGEVSLNKKDFTGEKTGLKPEDLTHGNYFGIYNVVNYLGALTSDVDFNSIRTTDNTDAGYEADGTTTFYGWKSAHASDRSRNNGTSHNKVALASGVYLELVEEPVGSASSTEKNYGIVTGVIQLDLINVMPGLGGGYVYAKNVHASPSDNSNGMHENLSLYNANAVNNTKYKYEGADTEIETSGNFIHNVKQIIDDCYPNGGDHNSPAHYWFIKGQFYVYDQYISAYTGSSTAYTKDIKLPLTITAGANGRLDLLDIKPNYYAYWYDTNHTTVLGSETGKETVEVNKKTYALNDVITYWDYMQLPANDRLRFVPETYVTVAEYQLTSNSAVVPVGTVMLPDQYAKYVEEHNNVYDPIKEDMVPVTDFLRPSNSISHENGYVLSIDLDNPAVWDAYFTPSSTTVGGKVSAAVYDGFADDIKSKYLDAPTYTPTNSGLYGQREYEVGDIITSDIVTTYNALKDDQKPATGQAIVERAYVAIAEASYTIGGVSYNTQPGVAITTYDYNRVGAEKNKFEPAVVCTNTIQYGSGEGDYVFFGEIISENRLQEIAQMMSDATPATGDAHKTKEQMLAMLQNDNFTDAYICRTAGNYGGNWYQSGTNYTALSTWASLSKDDRANFNFNYDALDALLLSNYPGTGNVGGMKPYDASTPGAELYSKTTPVDYTAKFVGYNDGTNDINEFTYGNKTYTTSTPAIDRLEYEALPNEQKHFAPIVVEAGTKEKPAPANYYIVSVQFVRGEVPYVVGQTMNEETYNSLDDSQKNNIIEVPATDFGDPGTYYFCREQFNVGAELTQLNGTKVSQGSNVVVGTLITADAYKNLPNLQRGFSIHGVSPTEKSTLFVSRESDIKDLSKDRVITLVYQYEYEESDVSMTHIEKIMERHIINIHLNFKSGVPTISQLQEPSIVLPGSTVGLKQPTTTPGAYEILGGGWELYTNQHDAEKHQNGASYINNATPMYWYQNGYFVAYYTKTYLGKTYSNPVQFKVANYHDIADVMKDTEHSMYIDHTDVDRASKIYISDDNIEIGGQTKSELDLLNDLYERTLTKKVIRVQSKNSDGVALYFTDETKTEQTTDVTDYPVLEDKTVYALDNVHGARNLDFFLSDDVKPEAYKTTWPSIGTGTFNDVNGVKIDKPCFAGNLHADGHTISGLSASLFHELCGNVYNLGVTGSFTGSGVADGGNGWVENSWVMTTGDVAENTPAVFRYSTTDGKKHLNNSYYLDSNTFTANDGAKAMPLHAFNDGEVAYNLNGFYLTKRYADQKRKSGQEYKYYTLKNGVRSEEPVSAYYDKEKDGAYYDIVDGSSTRYLGYVEERYTNPDFLYADGVIPTTENERLYETDGQYYPIWPDDYMFFGQMLTYGYKQGDDYTYQEYPSVINRREDDRLYMTDRSNRVFRVPAYFRNSTMDEAYYNTDAYFVAKTQDGTKTIHEGLTALDFTGKNDPDYAKGWDDANLFYTPIVDDSYSKLNGFHTEGITKNLLVYVDDNDLKADGTGKMDAVKDALSGDIKYQETYANYKTVAAANSNGVKGHLVIKSGDSYVAQNDHFLVDKQEFNAPIEYSFASGKRMWYQRTPELYATLDNKGWEGISLPFTVDLVTTQNKGEITHFYGTSNKGHEYWLRGYAGATYVDKDSEGNKLTDSDGNNISLTVVQMNRPSADNSTDTKTVGNSFLWDYYYSKRARVDGVDANTDDYQQNYYNVSRDYAGYAYQQAGVPYIVGFPGSDYYEFDLSGTFDPKNSGTTTPAKLAPQVITFASAEGDSINISDVEMAAAASVEGKTEVEGETVTKESGYSFKPNYLAINLAENSYVMNAKGDAFEIKASAVGVPFRPYFEVSDATPASPAPARTKALASKLVIGNSDSDTDNPGSAMADGTIRIWSENNTILIENNSSAAAMLTVYTSGGQLIKHVNVPSKGREVVKVNGRGIYLVGNTKVIVK